MPSTIYHPARLPGGERIDVDAEVFDIGRRIREGDPTIGVPAYPAASLTFNAAKRRFEVVDYDGLGRPYVAASHTKCDHTLLTKLRDGHWSKATDLMDRLIDERAELERDRARQLRDRITHELAPRMAADLRRANGIRDMWGYGD